MKSLPPAIVSYSEVLQMARRNPRLPVAALAMILALTLALTTAALSAASKLALRHLPVDLPGAPASVIPADLDGDGRLDLVIALAYTRWDQIGIEEESEIDGIDGLVEVLTIVPALLDRREVRAFLADGQGGYEPAAPPLPLPASVLSLEPGPPGIPVLALTDTGASALRLVAAESATQSNQPQSDRVLVLEPLIEEEPVLAGTGAFLSALRLVKDVDGDGVADLLLPAVDGFSLYRGVEGGLEAQPTSRIELPFDELEFRTGAMRRHYPLPEVRDVDGDGLPDLLLRWLNGGWERFYVLRNRGGGHFSPAIEPLSERWKERRTLRIDEEDDGEEESRPTVVYFGDLDGDSSAEYVTIEHLSGGDDQSMRKEMKEAKRPRFVYRIHRPAAAFALPAVAERQFEVEGYAFGQQSEEGGLRLPGGFQDLNGDGKQDLVTLTLDFSLLKMVTVLATKRLTLGLDFHLWCQTADGQFEPVRGLDLSGKFRINLNNLRLGQLSQFAGDFDGDGRADFVQMGRGKKVTIHRGRADCSYPSSPDLTLVLEEEPRNLALVKVADYDGDGRSDLLIVQPRPAPEPGVTPPVRLDLYLSGGAR